MTEATTTSRAVRFVITGLVTNGALLGLYWLLLRAGVDYRIAISIAYVLGVTWGYVQNRLWSFRSTASVAPSAAGYIATYVVVYFLHIALVAFLVERIGLGPFISGILSSLILLIPIFAVLDRLVFKGRKS